MRSLAARARGDGGFDFPSEAQDVIGAWGAAWWNPGTDPTPAPRATACDLCPLPVLAPCPTTLRSFFALREMLRRALRAAPAHLVLEMESNLSP